MAVEYRCCETKFFLNIGVIVFLVIFAGLMSGLTLGLMSLSLVDLEVLAKSGTPTDRKHAEKILPVVKNQHLLLCTLLICNAAAMETLPIFLDSLVTAWGAILISVTLILLFGEIIPQSICSRYGLAIGAALAPFVRVLVWICSPVAYPISKLLDLLLGHGHVALFRRAELKTLVDFHGNEAGKGGELTHDETTIIAGALELSDKTAGDAMTPISEIFSIDINAKLDRALMNIVMENGHSRMPVYYEERTNIIGCILSELSELETDLARAKKGKPPLKDRDGKQKRNLSSEAIEKKIHSTKAKIEKLERDMASKEDLKEIALGTSKINYLDPRITVAWCKRNEVPIEKVFNKSLLAKFAWAMDVDPSFRF